jgi:hypothetical protein
VGPCPHGMARPRIVYAGDGLQIWRVAAIMLNKQSRTADKGWSQPWGLSERLITLNPKKQVCYEMSNRASVGSCEHGNEPSVSIKFGQSLASCVLASQQAAVASFKTLC